jgi:hypothetical protein
MSVLLFVMGVIFFSSANAQPSASWQLDRTMKGDWVSFEVDLIGNTYLINQANQLRKYTPQGDSVAIYNDQRRYGNIGSLDVANPMLLLLYYPDYSTIVWLDRFLRPVNTLDLRASNIFSIGAVASSFDSKVWVFDKMEQRLKKLGQKGELLQQTPDLRQVLNKNIDPQSIQETQRRVYLYDSTQGVFVFDYFGNFEKNIEVKSWSHWAINGTAMHGIKDGELLEFELRSGVTTTTTLPNNKPLKKAQWSVDKQLYCLQTLALGTGAQLLIYTKKHD